MDQIETRSALTDLQVRDNRISGWGARYNSPSKVLSEGGRVFREVLLPGCFASSFRTPMYGDIRVLLNHDPAQVVERSTSTTMRIEDRPEGVWLDMELDEADAHIKRKIAKRIIRGMSFGWLAKGTVDRWETKAGKTYRYISDIPTLFEFSFVFDPAYEAATVRTYDHSAVAVPAPFDRWKYMAEIWRQTLNRR